MAQIEQLSIPELKIVLKEDVKIVNDDLAKSSQEIMARRAKWINWLILEKQQLANYNASLSKEKIKVYKFLAGIQQFEDDPILGKNIDNTGIRFMMTGNPGIIKIEKDIEIKKAKIEFINSASDILKSRSFVMSKLIELYMFKQGK